jgi:hypothetical protein
LEIKDWNQEFAVAGFVLRVAGFLVRVNAIMRVPSTGIRMA